MIVCSKKDSCANYKKRCIECSIMSSPFDTYPYYFDNALVDALRDENIKKKFDEINKRVCLKPFPYGNGIHIYHNVDRATGKTVDLIKYASTHNITILTTNQNFNKYVERMCEKFNLQQPKVKVITKWTDFINFMITDEYFVIDELEAFFSNVFHCRHFRGCSVRAECIKSAYLENENKDRKDTL